MYRLLKKIGLFLLLIGALSACRASCGCPMAEDNEVENESILSHYIDKKIDQQKMVLLVN